MILQICVGSSCHLRGSEQIVNLLQQAVEQHHLEAELTLTGSFCSGQCNQSGVTVRVDDEDYCGITPEGFQQFFEQHVLQKLKEEGAI